MKTNKNQSRSNSVPAGNNQRNHTPSAGSARSRSTAGEDHSSTDSSNQSGSKWQDPIANKDTPANAKKSRGYQNMNKRTLSQDYNKNLDEDVVKHYDSTSGFEEFDEYADEKGLPEGNDEEYNERYNDDRNENNELEELHTDTEVSHDLEEREISADSIQPHGKRKRIPSTGIAKKYGPIAQSENDSDNNPVSHERLKKAQQASSHKNDQPAAKKTKSMSREPIAKNTSTGKTASKNTKGATAKKGKKH